MLFFLENHNLKIMFTGYTVKSQSLRSDHDGSYIPARHGKELGNE